MPSFKHFYYGPVQKQGNLKKLTGAPGSPLSPGGPGCPWIPGWKIKHSKMYYNKLQRSKHIWRDSTWLSYRIIAKHRIKSSRSICDRHGQYTCWLESHVYKRRSQSRTIGCYTIVRYENMGESIRVFVLQKQYFIVKK